MHNCKHNLYYIFKKLQLYCNTHFIRNNNYLDFMSENMEQLGCIVL